MSMSGLPDMYVQSPRAEDVHIRQTTNALFIGKVVGIDSGNAV